MDRTERFYVMDRMLHDRKVVTRRQFLDALQVSLATFKRDLEYLCDRFHAPIVWNAEKRGYEFGAPDGVTELRLPGVDHYMLIDPSTPAWAACRGAAMGYLKLT